MNEFNYCPVCDKQNLVNLKGYERPMLAKCRNCQFIFSKHIPSETELFLFYSNYPSFESVSEITRKRFQQILDGFEKFRKTNNLIDVGCGDGFFLDEAKKRGWNVHGTEYALHYINICKQKGIHMQSGKLNPSNYDLEYFDIITSFEVIEHINYPVEELSNFNAITRKGGVVYITTPNFNSISRRMLKDNWSIIWIPEHLSYYTTPSIHYLLKRCGFRKLNIQTTGISIERARNAYFKNKQKNESHSTIYKSMNDKQIREQIESSNILKITKSILNFVLIAFKLGDTIKATYQKM